MAQLLVRNIPEDLVEALNRRASLNGRSVEAEHLLILQRALSKGPIHFRAKAAALRRATAGRFTDESADLIREERDRL